MNDRNFIRALERGLSVITVLNQHNGLGMQELMNVTGFSRSGLYRILETLIDDGYVILTRKDKKYRLTSKVRTLSMGYQPDLWLTEVVAPIFRKRTSDIIWQSALSIWRQGKLVVEYFSDTPSTITKRRFSAGWNIQIFESASGLAALAMLPDEISSPVIEDFISGHKAPKKMRAAIDLEIQKTRTTGFASYKEERFHSIAVPLRRSSRTFGTLAIQSETETRWTEPEGVALRETLMDIASEIEASLLDYDSDPAYFEPEPSVS